MLRLCGVRGRARRSAANLRTSRRHGHWWTTDLSRCVTSPNSQPNLKPGRKMKIAGFWFHCVEVVPRGFCRPASTMSALLIATPSDGVGSLSFCVICTAVGLPSRAVLRCHPSHRTICLLCSFNPKVWADLSDAGSSKPLSPEPKLVVEPAHEVLDTLSSLNGPSVKQRENWKADFVLPVVRTYG